MTKKCLTLVMVGLLLLSGEFTLVLSQTSADSKVEKIKSSVLKRGTEGKERVSVKMKTGSKLKGFINQSGEDSFTLKNAESGQTTVIAYRDVEKIGSSGLSKGAKIAIGISAAAAATLTILYIAFQNAIKDN